MNWNFGFFDVDTVRRAAIAAGLGTGASALFPEDAEGAVYSKDGRRLLNLLDNASKGALRETEPVFEFQEKLPKDVFATANQNGGELKTRNFAATRNNIQHYWNERHKHMSNQEIEDAVEALITGNERFYVEANKPYPHSIAALGQEKTGVRGSLAPSDNYTFLHQVNPLNNRRLLKMRSLWEMPDGSAVHPLAHTSEGRGLRSKRVSADGISEQNIADFSVPDKLKLPAVGVGSGLGAGLTLLPEEAFGWGQGGLRTSELRPEDSAPLRTGELRESGGGTALFCRPLPDSSRHWMSWKICRFSAMADFPVSRRVLRAQT